MRQRLPLIMSSAAFVLALLGWTPLGEAARNAVFPPNSVGTAQLKNDAVVSSKVKDGSLKKVDFAAGQLPAGPTGVAGPAGATGPSDAFGIVKDGPVATATPLSVIAHLPLGPGKYAIVAKAWFINSSGTQSVEPRCRLIAGGDFDQTRFALQANAGSNVSVAAVPFQLLHEFAAAGEVDLSCDNFGVPVSAMDIKIQAIKVANLTNGAGA